MARLKKYNELTKTIAFRVPISKEKKIKSVIKKLLKSYEPNRNPKT